VTSRRAIFVNRFYWPEEPATAQLLSDLAIALSANGWRVEVIARRPNRGSAKTEVRDGVTIHRVWTTNWGRTTLLGRLIDFLTYYVSASGRLLTLSRKGDSVVALTDPPLISLLVWPITLIRGARLICWVQDIYPEVAIQLTGHRWLALLKPLRNLVWRESAVCVVPGEDMASVLIANGVRPDRVSISPNWAPKGLRRPGPDSITELRSEWGLSGKFVMMYSGNLGRVHDLEPLIEIAHRLRDHPTFVLVFVGNGAQRRGLEALVKSHTLPNVRFQPPQPRASLSACLAVADIHFVTLLKGAERWVFPSKLYGIAKIGRPVVLIGDPRSELGGLITAGGFGAAFDRESTADVVILLKELLINQGRLRSMEAAALKFSVDGLQDATAVWLNALSRGLATDPKGGA
jgi:colanic acid biosynthesis glycosyl transferase WcaI